MNRSASVVDYAPRHRQGYLELLQATWGDRAISAEEFDWWFDEAPEGSVRSVVVHEDEVVAVAGHSLARIAVGPAADERIAQFSVHAVTAPAFRGRGLFRALETRHEEEGASRSSTGALAFASGPTRPLFLGPLDWTQIDRRRVWVRPLRSLAGRVPGLSPRSAARQLPSGVRRVDAFDGSAEVAYRQAVRRLGTHVVRDARYLDWRYARAPRDYRLLQADAGFAVVGRRRHRGVDTALLLDLVGDAPAVDILLRAAVAAAAGAEALLVVPSPVAPSRVLLRHGFVPSPVRLDFVGKGYDGTLPLAGDAWTVSLGDTDFF